MHRNLLATLKVFNEHAPLSSPTLFNFRRKELAAAIPGLNHRSEQH
jgi:hypothetical protein